MYALLASFVLVNCLIYRVIFVPDSEHIEIVPLKEVNALNMWGDETVLFPITTIYQ